MKLYCSSNSADTDHHVLQVFSILFCLKNLLDNNQLNSLSALDHPSMLTLRTEDADEISLIKRKHVDTRYVSSLEWYFGL